MVRQKVRSQFLLSQKKSHGKEKKVRTWFLLLKKKSHGKAKGKNSTHTFEMKNHRVG